MELELDFKFGKSVMSNRPILAFQDFLDLDAWMQSIVIENDNIPNAQESC